MKIALLLAVFVVGRVYAQRPCKVDLNDGTEITVPEGEFSHPDFCGKTCTCSISIPDAEEGFLRYTTSCACSIEEGGATYCAQADESIFVEGRGLCTCQMPAKILDCVEWDPTDGPSQAPSDPPTPAPIGLSGSGGNDGGDNGGGGSWAVHAEGVPMLALFCAGFVGILTS